jgi:hypothetical protein
VLTNRPVAALIIVLLGAGMSGELGAQTVSGRVVSGSPPAPVGGAFVLLVDSLGVVTQAALSDSEGSYVLVAPSMGLYTVRVQRGSYATTNSGPVRLSDGEAIRVDMHLPRPALLLPPVTITAPARAHPTGVLAGFYERMEKGWGYFITREEIEKRGARRISDLLHGIPDVRVIRRSELESTVRVGTELSRINVGPLSLGTDGAPQIVVDTPFRCSPILWVDGSKFGRADEVLDQVGPTDIEGIEFYRRSSEVPPEFGGIYARCGVLLIWTRRSSME